MSRREQLKYACTVWQSKKGIALPITFLVMFVSLTLLISTTYFFAISRISSESILLKVSAAKQDMFSLENSITSVTWSPGSSQIYYFDNWEGTLMTAPDDRRLVINVTDNSFYDIVFNSTIGSIIYTLPASGAQNEDFYPKGDSRAIVNQSASTMTQLHIFRDTESQRVMISYRPLAFSSSIASNNGKPVNNIRIYIINLNSSQPFTLQGNFHIKIACINVTSTTGSYDFLYQITFLTVKSILNNVGDTVVLPISSSEEGAIVNLEIVTCNVQLQRTGV